MEQARKNGVRAGLAPLGYLNVRDNNDKKDVVPDPNQRHLVIKIFEMYSTGNYSVRKIASEMEKLGLKNRRRVERPLLLWGHEDKIWALSSSS